MNLKMPPLMINDLRISRFMGSKRELVGGILSPRERAGVRGKPISVFQAVWPSQEVLTTAELLYFIQFYVLI